MDGVSNINIKIIKFYLKHKDVTMTAVRPPVK